MDRHSFQLQYYLPNLLSRSLSTIVSNTRTPTPQFWNSIRNRHFRWVRYRWSCAAACRSGPGSWFLGQLLRTANEFVDHGVSGNVTTNCFIPFRSHSRSLAPQSQSGSWAKQSSRHGQSVHQSVSPPRQSACRAAKGKGRAGRRRQHPSPLVHPLARPVMGAGTVTATAMAKEACAASGGGSEKSYEPRGDQPPIHHRQ